MEMLAHEIFELWVSISLSLSFLIFLLLLFFLHACILHALDCIIVSFVGG